MKQLFSLLLLLSEAIFLTQPANAQGCTENPTLEMNWAHFLVDHPVDESNQVHICSGEYANLNSLITPIPPVGISITWSNGHAGQYIEPVSPGTYHYTVTYPFTGCSYTSETVTVVDDAVEDEIFVTNSNGLLTVTNAVSFETIRWKRNGSFVTKPNGSWLMGSTYQMKRPGTYWAYASSGGCFSQSEQFTYSNNVIVLNSLKELELFQNEFIISVTDYMGARMSTDGEDMDSGKMYIVTIQNKTGVEQITVLKK